MVPPVPAGFPGGDAEMRSANARSRKPYWLNASRPAAGSAWRSAADEPFALLRMDLLGR